MAGPELAGLAVECHPPDVAQAIGPNLGPGVFLADKRVVFRDRVILTGIFVIDVDAMHLAEQRFEVLPVVVGIVTESAIAVRQVEVAIWSKNERAAVVVP